MLARLMRTAPRTITRLALTVLVPACAASAVAGGVSGARSPAVAASITSVGTTAVRPSTAASANASQPARRENRGPGRVDPGSSTGPRATVSPTLDLAVALPTPVDARTSGTVIFGGDIVPHGDLLASFDAHGPGSLYAPILPVIRAADIALLNFETPRRRRIRQSHRATFQRAR